MDDYNFAPKNDPNEDEVEVYVPGPMDNILPGFGKHNMETLRDRAHAESVRWCEVHLYRKGEDWIYEPLYLAAIERGTSTEAVVEIKTHALKVAGACPFIREYLKESFITDELDLDSDITIDLPIDGRVLKYIVEYMYIGTIKVVSEYAFATLEACHKLKLDAAKSLVGEYLGTQVTATNALRLFVAAVKFGCPELENAAGSFVDNNFNVVTDSEDWGHLDEKYVKNILCRDNLVVTAESDVLRALLRWAKFEVQQNQDGEEIEVPTRKEALERLMLDRKAVRLPYVAEGGKLIKQGSRARPKSSILNKLGSRMSSKWKLK